MGKVIILSILIFVGTVSSFGSTQTGGVGSLQVRASDGLIYFTISAPRSGVRPACAVRDYWILTNENSQTGKRQYAMLLAASLSGRQVKVTGSEDCTRWFDGEDINTIMLVP